MSADTENRVPTVRGWCTKEGGSHKSWKRRWFQTTPRFPLRLDYYTSDNCSTLKGSIDLGTVEDLKCTRVEDSNGKFRYGFQLVTNKRTWKLIADGENEGEYWKDAFTKIVDHVRETKGLPPLKKKKKSKHHHHHHKKDKKEKKESSSNTENVENQVQEDEDEEVAVAAAPPSKRGAKATSVTNSQPVKQPEPETEEEESAAEDEYYEEGEDDDVAVDPSEMFDLDIRECLPGEKYAVACEDYVGSSETELNIKRGQKIIIFDEGNNSGWLGAENKNGERGWVSVHFVQYL